MHAGITGITNTFDNSASGFAGSVAPVQQLVTLTAAQYAALSPKNANFLYLILFDRLSEWQ